MTRKSFIFSLFALIFVSVIIPFTVFLAFQRHELRKKAITPPVKNAAIKLIPSQSSIKTGDVFTVKLVVNPGAQSISSVQAAVSYSPNLMFIGEKVSGNIGVFNYFPNRVLPDRHLIQIASTIKDPTVPFYAAGAATYATLKFKAVGSGTAYISFQPGVTAIFGYGSNESILKEVGDWSSPIL